MQPNAAHEGLARLQRTGWVTALITQVGVGSGCGCGRVTGCCRASRRARKRPVLALPRAQQTVARALRGCPCALLPPLRSWQNVDRLHQKAGSPEVLELHGTTHE